MDISPEGNRIAVFCPHSLQRFVGCNDETAKKIAGLVYEFAIDYKLRDSLKEDARKALLTPAYVRMFNAVVDYDVFVNLFFEGISLYRYERPPFPPEIKDSEKIRAYFQNSPRDAAHIPLVVADIVRAFGEFAGKEVKPNIIESCVGFYDDPARACPVCGKSWERTWDE